MTLLQNLQAPSVIIGAVLGLIGSAIFFESQGLIKHNDNKDDYALSQYQAIFIDQAEHYRLSHKASNQHALCIDGYLFIRSDVNQAMQGLIIDYKNRGVKCQPEQLLSSEASSTPVSAKPLRDHSVTSEQAQ